MALRNNFVMNGTWFAPRNLFFYDNHREKAPSNKTPALTKKYKYVDLAVEKTRFSKNESSYWQNSVLCDRSFLYSSFYLSSDVTVLYGNDAFSILVLSS